MLADDAPTPLRCAGARRRRSAAPCVAHARPELRAMCSSCQGEGCCGGRRFSAHVKRSSSCRHRMRSRDKTTHRSLPCTPPPSIDTIQGCTLCAGASIFSAFFMFLLGILIKNNYQ